MAILYALYTIFLAYASDTALRVLRLLGAPGTCVQRVVDVQIAVAAEIALAFGASARSARATKARPPDLRQTYL
jgi:hypothetical protein